MSFSERVVEAHKETLGSCRVSLLSFFFTKNLCRAFSLKPAANNKLDFTAWRSQTHHDVIVNDVSIRLCTEIVKKMFCAKSRAFESISVFEA